jgi:hypothetical protein
MSLATVTFTYCLLFVQLVRGIPLPFPQAADISPAAESVLLSASLSPSAASVATLVARPSADGSLSLISPSATSTQSDASHPSSSSSAATESSSSTDAPFPSGSDFKVAYIIPVVVVGTLLLLATLAGYIWGRKKKNKNKRAAALYRPHSYDDWDHEDRKSWINEKEAALDNRGDERGWRWGTSSPPARKGLGSGYSSTATTAYEANEQYRPPVIISGASKKVRAKQMLAESRTRYAPSEIDRVMATRAGVRENGSLVDRARKLYDSVGSAGRAAGRRLRRDKTLPLVPRGEEQETIMVGGRVNPRWGGRRIQPKNIDDAEGEKSNVVVELKPEKVDNSSSSSDDSASTVVDSSATTLSDPPTSITSYDPCHAPAGPPTGGNLKEPTASAIVSQAQSQTPPRVRAAAPAIRTEWATNNAVRQSSKDLPSSLQPGAQPPPSSPLSPPMNPELFYSTRVGVPMPAAADAAAAAATMSSFSLTGLAALLFPGYAQQEEQPARPAEEPFGSSYTNLPSKKVVNGGGGGTNSSSSPTSSGSPQRRGALRTRASVRELSDKSPPYLRHRDMSEPGSTALSSRATMSEEGTLRAQVGSPYQYENEDHDDDNNSHAFDRVGAIVKKSRVHRALAQPREPLDESGKREREDDLVRRARTMAGLRLQREAENRRVQLRRSESTMRC